MPVMLGNPGYLQGRHDPQDSLWWNWRLRRLVQWYELGVYVSRHRNHLRGGDVPELDYRAVARGMQR